MFNPKGNSILDQELSISGLEMSVDPFTIGNAALQIGQGIFGMNEADRAADAAEKEYEAQVKFAKKLAKKQNKYNKKRFKAEKKNFREMQEYNFQTALTKWKYDQDIQNYQYQQQMRAYNKDQENLKNQLHMNNIAAKQAYISEQRVLNEIAAEQTFQRTNQYIENLQSEGRAKLGQAGRSNDRAVRMTAAEHGRNLAVLDASFTSSIAQHDMNMFDIALNKFGADLNARANAMLRPERLPDIPSPTKPPEPKWVKPMKIMPQYVAKPDTDGMRAQGLQSLIGGIGGAAGTIGGALGKSPTKVGGTDRGGTKTVGGG